MYSMSLGINLGSWGDVLPECGKLTCEVVLKNSRTPFATIFKRGLPTKGPPGRTEASMDSSRDFSLWASPQGMHILKQMLHSGRLNTLGTKFYGSLENTTLKFRNDAP